MIADKDTIVAPATPPGEGGIAVIRMSGPDAETLLCRFFRATAHTGPQLISHRLYHGRFFDGNQRAVDEVMGVIMRQPHSYTREDVVEIHCHGGRIPVQAILDVLLGAGARLADPGEFTLRAFLNGRLDLARAEGVIELIRARSNAAGQLALRQLDGKLSRVVHDFRQRLVALLVELETWIDFPDEDIEPPVLAGMHEQAASVLREVNRLVEGFDTGRVIREGLAILILGRPNVGKSSLLNALLGEARAIVTDVPGTTRDIIEESLNLGGVPVRVVDTAGVRQTEDPIESEGVRRARDKVDGADLVLLVVDGSRNPEPDDRLALEMAPAGKTLLVVNKSDLPAVELFPPWTGLPRVRISSHTGMGLGELEDSILRHIRDDLEEPGESVLVSDRRHLQALLRCREALERFGELTAGVAPGEILALEIREALGALGTITGETTPEEVLEGIFSRFCIGK